ncbi:MAG: hypothetical protein ABI361_14285 [Nitrososphaera sp.]
MQYTNIFCAALNAINAFDSSIRVVRVIFASVFRFRYWFRVSTSAGSNSFTFVEWAEVVKVAGSNLGSALDKIFEKG